MIYVAESAIHGKGLFAKDLIPEGTVIGHIEGRTTREDGPYVLWISEEWGVEVLNEMRYLNHSNDANAVYYDDLTVEALRDIQPGEEITHDYRGDDGEDVDFEDGDEVEMEFSDEEEVAVV